MNKLYIETISSNQNQVDRSDLLELALLASGSISFGGVKQEEEIKASSMVNLNNRSCLCVCR